MKWFWRWFGKNPRPYTVVGLKQERRPIDITKKFPVGSKFLVYCQNGMSMEWEQWSGVVLGLDLNMEEITIEISQDWDGADYTDDGDYWTETRTIKFRDFLIPLLKG